MSRFRVLGECEVARHEVPVWQQHAAPLDTGRSASMASAAGPSARGGARSSRDGEAADSTRWEEGGRGVDGGDAAALSHRSRSSFNPGSVALGGAGGGVAAPPATSSARTAGGGGLGVNAASLVESAASAAAITAASAEAAAGSGATPLQLQLLQSAIKSLQQLQDSFLGSPGSGGHAFQGASITLPSSPEAQSSLPPAAAAAAATATAASHKPPMPLRGGSTARSPDVGSGRSRASSSVAATASDAGTSEAGWQ